MSIIAPPDERLEVAREADERIRAAGSVEQLRQVFVDYYGRLGWRALCRMAFLDQPAEKALRLE